MRLNKFQILIVLVVNIYDINKYIDIKLVKQP